jgi:perosamine synthetase
MKIIEPNIDGQELEAILRVFESGTLTQGPETKQFENAVSGFVGSLFAHATSSATTGLHLGLVALGVKTGDEIIVPNFSFPATANVVEQIGAKPVFVDIDPLTFNIDPDQIENKISSRTKAIMPVHAFGLCADMTRICKIAKDYGLFVIEDAACALGSKIQDQHAGTFGDAGVYSFHPRKVVTTGEGGMVVTSDERLSDKMTILRSHGGVRGDYYLEFLQAGFNYRLSDVNSAIGVVQMKKITTILEHRRKVAFSLIEKLASIDELSTPAEPDGYVHSFQSFVISLRTSIDRDKLISELKKLEIESTLGTYALHLQPIYREKYGLNDLDFPTSTFAQNQLLTLPINRSMDEKAIDFLVESLKVALTKSRR